MPELPDVLLYVTALERFICGRKLEGSRLRSPFLLKTVDVALSELHGCRITTIERIGKRLVLGFEKDLFAVVHLMIAGRFHWKKPMAAANSKAVHLALDFENGSLFLTEASTKKRASLHLVRGRDALDGFASGGLDVLTADLEAFRSRLLCENRTLKRALTSPRLFDGIGNAYSDEILHRARLAPHVWTTRLDESECARLHAATREVLNEWIVRLREEVGDRFPEKVTAFRDGMAVHGRFGLPCPDCGTKVQRIVHAENECNYCPTCQCGGKLLADRALSQLLGKDWPKTLEEWEEMKESRRSK